MVRKEWVGGKGRGVKGRWVGFVTELMDCARLLQRSNPFSGGLPATGGLIDRSFYGRLAAASMNYYLSVIPARLTGFRVSGKPVETGSMVINQMGPERATLTSRTTTGLVALRERPVNRSPYNLWPPPAERKKVQAKPPEVSRTHSVGLVGWALVRGGWGGMMLGS